MEKLLRELLEKVDEIKKSQEAILSRLDDCIILPKFTQQPSTSDKKAEEEARKEEMIAVIMHGARIRDKFNLAVTPQTHRIIAYLRTGNESAFEGLKRKK